MPTPLERVFEATECRTQVELAKLLGIKQSSVAAARRRGTIPAEWLLKLLHAKGVNPDWILTGEGARMLQTAYYVESIEPSHACSEEVRSLEECSMEDLMAEVIRRVIRKSPELTS